MYPSHFYHGSLRKINAVFGSIFNNLKINRYDSEGAIIKTFTVPITQAQRRSFLVRLHEDTASLGIPNTGITLPRMSYEFVGLGYRAEDKLQNSRYVTGPDSSNASRGLRMYNSAPYDVAINLNIYAQNFSDILQLAEQIVPFFTPHISVTINEIPELEVKNDIKIRLDGIDPNIEYEGNIGVDRLLIWTLNFTVATHLFHPVADLAVIKRTIENIYTGWDETRLDAIWTQEINPLTADPGDAYTIDETIEEF